MRRRMLTLAGLIVLLSSFLFAAMASPVFAIVELMVLGAVLATDPFHLTRRWAVLNTELARKSWLWRGSWWFDERTGYVFLRVLGVLLVVIGLRQLVASR